MNQYSEETLARVLNAPMPGGITGEYVAYPTVGDALRELLRKVWTQEEGFDGKRPFGNSGWQFDFYAALGTAGLIRYTEDEDGCYQDADTDEGDRLILAAIDYAFRQER